MIDGLPRELLRQILQLLCDPPTSLSLLLTSKSFHEEAQPLFYHTICLTEAQRTFNHTRLEHLLSTMSLDHGRIARFVKVFEIRIFYGSNFPKKAQENLNELLLRLPNLKSFLFESIRIAGDNVTLPLIDQCNAPFQLTYFSWAYGPTDPSSLAKFIDSQSSSLRHLSLRPIDSPIIPLSSPLPQLRALNCSATAALSILSLGHVTHLRATYVGLVDDPFCSLDDALSEVKVFEAMGSYPHMIALAKRMPTLQGLGLFSQDEPLLAVIPYLGALSELKVQYLRFEGPHEEDTQWMDTLRGCFETIPTLRWVELWSPESGAWDRWACNAEEPATIPSHSSSYSDWLSEWEEMVPFH